MIYFIASDDFSFIKKTTNGIVALYKSKNKITENFNQANFEEKNFTSKLGGTSLFDERYIIISEDLVEDNFEFFKKNIENINNSENVFVFVESSINAETKKTFISNKDNFFESKTKAVQKHNPFLITDALLKKEKKLLWKLYREEIDRGESGEAILGRFAWAIKTLSFVVNHPTEKAETFEISPFVYQKTKALSKSWNKAEVDELYFKMLFDFSKDEDMEIHLEKLILSM